MKGPHTMTIVVFQAVDGRWTYCPAIHVGSPAFNMDGEFDTAEQAEAHARANPTARGCDIEVRR